MPISLKDLLSMERSHRTGGKWLSWTGNVTNDHGVVVTVAIKSYGFYNQVLRLNDDQVNYCSGHTKEKVGLMHAHLKDTINKITS
jgi:hypothetical protein